MNLSPKQQEIVNHNDGALLVKAGPGSGKTRVLTERVKQLLTTKKRGKVLALTFSNRAAEEMRSRLENDSEVADSIGRVAISTIHSFCLEMVQSRGYLIGLRPDVSLFESEADRVAILREIILNEPDYTSLLSQEPADFLLNCLSSISEQKRGLILPEASNETEPFPSIYRKYNDVLASQNAMDFDDILFFTYRILTENLDVAQLYNSVYRYICIDEAQDLNEVQYRVIQALCGADFKNIMMVGDENQSIYAFNGSSSRYMSESFVRDFSPKMYILDENFRSAKHIFKYANDLKGIKVDVSRYYYDGELNINSYANETEEAWSVINTIEQLKLNGHKDIEGAVTYEKIAVIARNKYVFSYIESEFTQAGIPYYFKQSRSGIVSETSFLQAFDLILRLIINPMDLYHKQLLCKLANKTMTEIDSKDSSETLIENLLAENDLSWLSGVFAGIKPDSILDLDNKLKVLRDNMPQLLSDNDKYLLEKDISEWGKHWQRFKNRVPRENRTLLSFRNAIALGKTQDLDDSGVALLTAHMSKGLEFDVVFIIGLTEGTFPDYRAVDSSGEAIVQEKNNMYVAVTRAKRLCYLSYPLEKQMPWGGARKQVRSRFVLNNGNYEEVCYA
jgi:DNA helicase-2/ATP-dependent DNA helicase PcrA